MGFHGIGHSDVRSTLMEKHIATKDSNEYENELLEIEALLKIHDSYIDGKECPDSAIVYTIEALQLADSCFGINSDIYIL